MSVAVRRVTTRCRGGPGADTRVDRGRALRRGRPPAAALVRSSSSVGTLACRPDGRGPSGRSVRASADQPPGAHSPARTLPGGHCRSQAGPRRPAGEEAGRVNPKPSGFSTAPDTPRESARTGSSASPGLREFRSQQAAQIKRSGLLARGDHYAVLPPEACLRVGSCARGKCRCVGQRALCCRRVVGGPLCSPRASVAAVVARVAVALTREGQFGWLGAVGVSSSAGPASCTSPGLACAGGATYRIGDCPGASGFGDGIRKMHSKMKYSGKAV